MKFFLKKILAGPNPLFGGLKTAVSIFGKSSHTWVEGEGMVHAVYFKQNESGDWIISYNNKYVQSQTLSLERERLKPGFIPALEGDSPAIFAAYLFNTVNSYIPFVYILYFSQNLTLRDLHSSTIKLKKLHF